MVPGSVFRHLPSLLPTGQIIVIMAYTAPIAVAVQFDDDQFHIHSCYLHIASNTIHYSSQNSTSSTQRYEPFRRDEQSAHVLQQTLCVDSSQSPEPAVSKLQL